MKTTIKYLKMPENLLGMQISNFRYANMDFFKTPHIQIRFMGKNPVFKYEFLVLFSHPCRLQLRDGEELHRRRRRGEGSRLPTFGPMSGGEGCLGLGRSSDSPKLICPKPNSISPFLSAINGYEEKKYTLA